MIRFIPSIAGGGLNAGPRFQERNYKTGGREKRREKGVCERYNIREPTRPPGGDDRSYLFTREKGPIKGRRLPQPY